MASRGRPTTSNISRTEQLRRAKRRQRAKQKRAGLVHVQLTLPRITAEKLAVARKSDDFLAVVQQVLDQTVVNLGDYPLLADLAWNRRGSLIPAREALGLYERNWRHVDVDKLTAAERQLIASLAERFGSGLIHV